MVTKRRFLLAVCCAALCGAARAEVRYTVKDLGPGIGSDLNNKGVAILYQVDGGGVPSGPSYFWDGTQLSTLPMSSLPPGYFTSLVTVENDNGQLAGWVAGSLSDPNPFGKLAFWANGASQPPTIIGEHETNTIQPVFMNASGHVVFNTLEMWSPDAGMTPLPTLGGAGAETNGISDANVVVGVADTPDGLKHAVTWQDGQIHQLDSGVWPVSAAQAVTHDGVIAGLVASQDLLQRRLALWSADGILQTIDFPVGTTNQYARSINHAHQIVGSLDTSTGNSPFLFENGAFTALRDLVPADTPAVFFSGEGPFRINDKGQILLRGDGHTVLLTPIPSMARALSIAGGLRAASASDTSLDVQPPAGISIVDAVRLARKASGLEP